MTCDGPDLLIQFNIIQILAVLACCLCVCLYAHSGTPREVIAPKSILPWIEAMNDNLNSWI